MTTVALAFKTRNDLPVETREAMVALLNRQLANLVDLHSQTKHAHWNVKGEQFIALHKLYDELAEALEHYIDDVAERAVALGGYARGTLRMAAAGTEIAEFPEDVVNGLAVTDALAARYAEAARAMRAAIEVATHANDLDTADLLTEISRGLDKWLWFLEAHLQ
ncbi:MAG: DNA starvation/stationary phase protection protein Dps [Thermoflexales bacterium]